MLGTVINSIFFLSMGVVALIKPQNITNLVGIKLNSIDARNEVRAVYGGFGIAIAAILSLALINADYRSGILITVIFALLGMAFGRVLSAILEKPGFMPVSFFFLECTLAGLLAWDLPITV